MKMTMTQARPGRAPAEYRHEALLYSGLDEFLLGTVPFVRAAVAHRDPVLVVVSRDKVDLLRARLEADADQVAFADMALVGGNPARIIAKWREFVASHSDAAQLWGVGEPTYAGRSASELGECQLHEALLNVAFDAATPLALVCPYDLEALAVDMIGEACRTHPFVRHRDELRECGDFQQVDLARLFDRPVPPRPPETAALSFQSGDLGRLRGFVADQAALAGLDLTSTDSMVLAVNEIATNSVRHGGGRGELHAWTDGTFLVCEVRDSGHITAPLVGRLRPPLDATGGGGLWVANQVCDLVQIYSSARGTVIRAWIGIQQGATGQGAAGQTAPGQHRQPAGRSRLPAREASRYGCSRPG
jgi:anti-sigma regulatory factor (Ser/Thr protein kinase)